MKTSLFHQTGGQNDPPQANPR